MQKDVMIQMSNDTNVEYINVEIQKCRKTKMSKDEIVDKQFDICFIDNCEKMSSSNRINLFILLEEE